MLKETQSHRELRSCHIIFCESRSLHKFLHFYLSSSLPHWGRGDWASTCVEPSYQHQGILSFQVVKELNWYYSKYDEK